MTSPQAKIARRNRALKRRSEKHDASNWPESFAPRNDLPEAESVPEIKRKHPHLTDEDAELLAIGAAANPIPTNAEFLEIARRAGKFDDLDDFGRRLLAQKGSIPADVALEIDGPRLAGLTSEMPDDLRGLALEGVQKPYEDATTTIQPEDHPAFLPAIDDTEPTDDLIALLKLHADAEIAAALELAERRWDGDRAKMREWLEAPADALDGKSAREVLSEPGGVNRVLRYLRAEVEARDAKRSAALDELAKIDRNLI
jgi:hypothetical protein